MSNYTNVYNTNTNICFVILAFDRWTAIFAYEMQMNMNIEQKNNIKPGDGLVRSKSFLGIIDHYGLYVGRSMVIENHPLSGVRLVTLSEFLNGRKLLKVKPYPGLEWTRSSAVNRAYEMIGTQYSVFEFNCEHFVNYIHQVGIKSGQADVAKGLVFSLLAFGVIAAVSGK